MYLFYVHVKYVGKEYNKKTAGVYACMLIVQLLYVSWLKFPT